MSQARRRREYCDAACDQSKRPENAYLVAPGIGGREGIGPV